MAEVCPITDEPLGPGETVSRMAVNQLATKVSDLPTLMSEVQLALGGLRQGEPTVGSSVAGSRPPIGLGLLELVDEMRDSINTWAADFAHWVNPGMRFRNGDWSMIRALIRDRRDQLRRWVEAPDFVDEVAYAVDRLEYLASPNRAVTLYAGPCPTCGLSLYAWPEDQSVECRECHTVVVVDEARHGMLSRLAEMELPISQAIDAVSATTGFQVTLKQVRNLATADPSVRRATRGGYLYSVRALVDFAQRRADRVARGRSDP